MRNELTRFAVLSSMLLTFAESHADMVTVASFSVWSTVYGTDIVRVTSPYIVNPAGCSDSDSYMVLSTLSRESKSRVYATLLSAKMQGTGIQLSISPSTCESNRPAIDAVILQ